MITHFRISVLPRRDLRLCEPTRQSTSVSRPPLQHINFIENTKHDYPYLLILMSQYYYQGMSLQRKEVSQPGGSPEGSAAQASTTEQPPSSERNHRKPVTSTADIAMDIELVKKLLRLGNNLFANLQERQVWKTAVTKKVDELCEDVGCLEDTSDLAAIELLEDSTKIKTALQKHNLW